MMDGEETSKCGAASIVVLPATDYYDAKYQFPPSKCSVFQHDTDIKTKEKIFKAVIN